MSMVISIANKFATPYYWQNSVEEVFVRDGMNRHIVRLYGIQNVPKFTHIEDRRLAALVTTTDEEDRNARAVARLAYDAPFEHSTYFTTEVAPMSFRYFFPWFLPRGLNAFYSVLLPSKEQERQQILKLMKGINLFFVSGHYVVEEDGHSMFEYQKNMNELHCIFTTKAASLNSALHGLFDIRSIPGVRYAFLLAEEPISF